MDILNEMAKKLNFTYTMHVIPVAIPRANDTEELSYNVSCSFTASTPKVIDESATSLYLTHTHGIMHSLNFMSHPLPDSLSSS